MVRRTSKRTDNPELKKQTELCFSSKKSWPPSQKNIDCENRLWKIESEQRHDNFGEQSSERESVACSKQRQSGLEDGSGGVVKSPAGSFRSHWKIRRCFGIAQVFHANADTQAKVFLVKLAGLGEELCSKPAI